MLPTDRVLGIAWASSTYMYEFKVSNKFVPEIKKGILSVIKLIFDSMSLIAPVIVKTNLLIQELGRRGLDWDKKIPDDLIRQWNT